MHPDTMLIEVPPMLEAELQRLFLSLYADLRRAFPHPFDWIGVLERPRWWQVRARRAHAQVLEIFASHGLIVTPYLAQEFLHRTEPQQIDEDAGGAMIRRLRTVFQWQTGVPYRRLTAIEGGLAHAGR